jgi:hypothetical protein
MKRTVLVAAISILVSTSGLAAQAGQTPAAESFSWSGELVALDESARTLTVKARVVGEQAITELSRLKAGTRILSTWSGFTDSAEGILRVAAETAKFEERFTFPVEFVSYDPDRKYVSFKVKLTEGGFANVKSVKAGEWVTAVSPHGVSSKTTPVARIKPYSGSFN